MNETHRRPWWRLNGVTLVAGATLFLSLATANFIGDDWIEGPVKDYRFGSLGGYYGWPCRFGVDSVSWNWLTEARKVQKQTGRKPPEFWWPLNRTVSIFAPAAGIIDAAICMAVLLGSLWTIERACRQRAIRLRFSLQFIFAATGLVAIYFAFPANLAFAASLP